MFDNLEEILDQTLSDIVRKAKINIGATQVIDGKRRRIDSTGKLRNSLSYDLDVSNSGKSYSASISMEEYGIFQDQGVKGAFGSKPSANKSKFSYKPSSKLPIPYIKDWIKDKPIRVRDSSGAFIKATPARINSLAYLIARSIKENGLSATGFLSNPLEEEFNKLPQELVEAFGLDIDSFLTDGI